MKIIEADNVDFTYKTIYDEQTGKMIARGHALEGFCASVEKGSYTAILGSNGSGKSTFAKLIDVIEVPDKGRMTVFGIDTADRDSSLKIRGNCALVFQNPDNQIVGTIVEEDVAFGPENLGIPNPELRARVDQALSYVGIKELSKRQAASLSGGQKQKLAIAGALALKPGLLILDEATAMLDPSSREDFLYIVEKLHKEEGMTVLTITHDMTEAGRCENIIVLKEGLAIMEGAPEDIFFDEEKVIGAGLELPVHITLLNRIAEYCCAKDAIKKDDLVSEERSARRVCDILLSISGDDVGEMPEDENVTELTDDTIMSVDNISFSYDDKEQALRDVSLRVKRGELLAVVGQSGCGKTTLISHLNGIIKPQTGNVILRDRDGREFLTSDKKDIPEIRRRVGLVFQYPEYQLFEETVYKDIGYGLRKLKIPAEEHDSLIREAASKVGLAEKYLARSPFELSGGQKRRVAIAGVIVMKPDVLVLDEPASGLDPKGRREIFDMIENLKKSGTTIVLVTHNMDDAARYADRICCLKDGVKVFEGRPEELYDNRGKAEEAGVALPYLYRFSSLIRRDLSASLPGIVFGGMRPDPRKEACSLIRSVLKYRREHDVQ